MLCLNKELQESIYTNNLVINISDNDYNMINCIIRKLRKKYYYQFQNLRKYQQGLEKMYFHSNLIKQIIMDVLSNFDFLKKYNVCAFLTGSFARCSSRKNSDIDFHLSYLQKYKEDMFKYEEMIYYIISSIVGIKRSNVHPMLITRLDRKNMDFLQKKLDDHELTVNLHSSIGDVYYKFSSNTKRRLYLQHGNNNSLFNIFAYLKYEVEHNNKEWCHTFYVFTLKNTFKHYYEKLFKYKKKIISKQRLKNRLLRIKDKLLQVEELLKNENLQCIKKWKLIYQKKEFAAFNEYISYKRDVALIQGIDWQYINYYDNYYDNQISLNNDKIFKNILDYLFELSKLVEPLGDGYSLHNDEEKCLFCYNKLEKKRIDIKIELLKFLGDEYGKISYYNANSSL